MTRVPFIKTAMGINVIVNGQNRLIPVDHKHHDEILAGLRAGNYDILNLLDEIKQQVRDFNAAGVDFQLVHGELFYHGTAFPDKFVTDHVMKMLDKGYKPEPLIRCLEKVKQNPNPDSVRDFWTFMQNTGLAIADDGDILAFKYVAKVSEMADGPDKEKLVAMGAEYTDAYSHKFDYTPGKIAFVPRHLCPYEPGNDCGVGLHIGDYSYVRSQPYILAGKFSPADVTSIGSNESRKIRVARFQCLHLVDPNNLDSAGYKEPVYSVRDGYMAKSDYARQYTGQRLTPQSSEYAVNESAEHWSR